MTLPMFFLIVAAQFMADVITLYWDLTRKVYL